MNVYGLRVGPGEISARLQDGQVAIQPMDVQVSEGRFTFAPAVRLNPAPAELLLSSGPLLNDVHLSPEICARGLKFVAPILAESTVADGSFSVTLGGGHLPLDDPAPATLRGEWRCARKPKPAPWPKNSWCCSTSYPTFCGTAR